jgi:hypothetical protein
MEGTEATDTSQHGDTETQRQAGYVAGRTPAFGRRPGWSEIGNSQTRFTIPSRLRVADLAPADRAQRGATSSSARRNHADRGFDSPCLRGSVLVFRRGLRPLRPPLLRHLRSSTHASPSARTLASRGQCKPAAGARSSDPRRPAFLPTARSSRRCGEWRTAPGTCRRGSPSPDR